MARIAAQVGLPLFILSGRFGLLNSSELIPYYDHLLEADEVPKLVGVVSGQLRKWRIHELAFYTAPIEQERQLQPYADLLLHACTKAGTGLSFELLEETDMSAWKERMKEFEGAKSAFVRDRSDGERMFTELVKRFPDDGMLYFKRGESYEQVGELELALQDFRRAESLFPVRDWKERARRKQSNLEVDTVTSDDLGRMRRQLIRLLDHLEKRSGTQRENLSERVSRLREEGHVPPNIANWMHSILRMRNESEYKGTLLTRNETTAIKAAWAEVTDWGKAKGWTAN